jgi:hypothetical protein
MSIACARNKQMQQVRIKQLITSDMSPLYIEKLPPTPRDLLRQFPDLAVRLFSAEDPPVSCPLDLTALQAVRSKIKMRGNEPFNHGLQGQLLAFSACVFSYLCSQSAVTTALDHACMHLSLLHRKLSIQI